VPANTEINYEITLVHLFRTHDRSYDLPWEVCWSGIAVGLPSALCFATTDWMPCRFGSAGRGRPSSTRTAAARSAPPASLWPRAALAAGRCRATAVRRRRSRHQVHAGASRRTLCSESYGPLTSGLTATCARGTSARGISGISEACSTRTTPSPPPGLEGRQLPHARIAATRTHGGGRSSDARQVRRNQRPDGPPGPGSVAAHFGARVAAS
jgi:hypothetical protein